MRSSRATAEIGNGSLKQVDDRRREPHCVRQTDLAKRDTVKMTIEGDAITDVYISPTPQAPVT